MSRAFRLLRRPRSHSTLLATGTANGPSVRSANLSHFAEGDRVLVDGKRLTAPLRHGQIHNTRRGFISHSDLIGKPAVRSSFRTSTNFPCEVVYPSLEEYVSLTPRKVTPIYASYASLVVSLLDLHPEPPDTSDPETSRPHLEILEAGTGHGALTLYLARAIAAANPARSTGSATSHAEYSHCRRAVIHTVEITPDYSAHAQKLISQFRRGLYLPNIDFYVGSLSDWLDRQFASRQPSSNPDESLPQFLDHALLDLAGSDQQIPQVVQALKPDGTLTVFVPSITQITDCVAVIQNQNLPMVMNQVLELGEGVSNGRQWDVRLVKRRKRWAGEQPRQQNADKDEEDEEDTDKKPMENGLDTVSADESLADSESVASADEVEDPEEPNQGLAVPSTAEEVGAGGEPDRPVFVCRPKVGKLTMGGGFIGMWRKVGSPMQRDA